jgi:enoyl-CoA hydratase/carnithine racemase
MSPVMPGLLRLWAGASPGATRSGPGGSDGLRRVRVPAVTDGPVRVDTGGETGVCRITLERPHKLNALDDATRADLHAALRDVAERDDIRVVVLAGAGRAFSAGADLAERVELPPDPLARRRASGRWQRVLEDLERLPQVTVARLQSHVIGGAALLAAACDLRVAADDLSVAIPEVAIGIPLTWAGLPRLVREIGLPRTRELVMTGRRLGAAEAQAWGYVHRVVPAAELDAAVDALVAELLAQPAPALAMTVDALRALGRALSAPETAWADPDLLRWSLRDLGAPTRDR